MSGKTDWLVVTCAAVCILCLTVVAFVSSTVIDTKSTTMQIQHERAANIRRSCYEQNDRHDKTVDTLNRLVLKRLRNPAPSTATADQVKVLLAAALKHADASARSQTQQSIGSTTLLIEALAPHRDCEQLVAQLVDTK